MRVKAPCPRREKRIQRNVFLLEEAFGRELTFPDQLDDGYNRASGRPSNRRSAFTGNHQRLVAIYKFLA